MLGKLQHTFSLPPVAKIVAELSASLFSECGELRLFQGGGGVGLSKLSILPPRPYFCRKSLSENFT
jgi:hypothetical protein